MHKLHRVPSYDLRTQALDAYDVIAMGTLNGARAVGFQGRVGALEAGMKADAILVDLDRALNDPVHVRLADRRGLPAPVDGIGRQEHGERHRGRTRS